MANKCFEASPAATAEGLNDLRIEYIDVNRLRADPGNARVHPPKQIQKLAASIRAFGFVVPLLVDDELKLVAGHGRLLAAKSIGLTEVPVVRIGHLTAPQLRLLQVADNRLAELSGWDKSRLAADFRDLTTENLSLDLGLSGFDLPRIELIVSADTKRPPVASSRTDLLRKGGPRVSQTGDLWLLGPHRVWCGDPHNTANLHLLMSNELAALTILDPLAGQDRSKLGAGDPDALGELLGGALQSFKMHCASGAKTYLLIGWRVFQASQEAVAKAGLRLLDLAVWDAGLRLSAGHYDQHHELVLVLEDGAGPHPSPPAAGSGVAARATRGNVWRYPAIPLPKGKRAVDVDAQAYPMKPVGLFNDIISENTEPGDVVAAPFLGDGTILVAAEATGRRCFAAETNPERLDAVVRRWEAVTGLTARHGVTGRPFAARESSTRNPKVER